MKEEPKIPNLNLYYLLSYAWNFASGRGIRQVQGEPLESLLELCVWEWMNHLAVAIQQGSLAHFHPKEEELEVVRGKILWSAPQANPTKIRCRYSDHSLQHPFTASLASIFLTLQGTSSLSPYVRKRLATFTSFFKGIEPEDTVPSSSGSPRLNSLCQLSRCLTDMILPQEGKGSYAFTSFWEEDQLMWKVFEGFVRNFYRKEQRTYRVHSRRFPWRNTEPFSEHAFSFLPQMETDVVLESDDKHIIIETKFYREAFRKRFAHKKLISGHLYQLFAYLQNYPLQERSKLSGCLLYPTLETSFSLDYHIHNVPVKVLGIRLDTEPKDIQREMLKLIQKN
ncbi:MAG: hypothetical protein AAFR66_07940 [Bacteroidota bacterium]